MRARYIALVVAVVGSLVAMQVALDTLIYAVPWLLILPTVLIAGPLKLSRKVLRPAGRQPPLTGPPLAKASWLSGSVGDHWVSKGIRVIVHADRVIVGVATLTDRTIMVDQIRPTRTGELGIEIGHSAPGLISPVALWLPEDHPVRQALLELVSR